MVRVCDLHARRAQRGALATQLNQTRSKVLGLVPTEGLLYLDLVHTLGVAIWRENAIHELSCARLR